MVSNTNENTLVYVMCHVWTHDHRDERKDGGHVEQTKIVIVDSTRQLSREEVLSRAWYKIRGVVHIGVSVGEVLNSYPGGYIVVQLKAYSETLESAVNYHPLEVPVTGDILFASREMKLGILTTIQTTFFCYTIAQLL